MTGIHPVQIYGHTAEGASTAQVNAMCENLKMGTVIGKTRACANSTVAWFFGEKRVPQIAARVEQISEWITMWRGFDVGTRRRIRKVWGKRLPLWQKTTEDGTKRQAQSLPLSVQTWERAGSRAQQVSSKRQKPVLLWMELCSTRRRSSTGS